MLEPDFLQAGARCKGQGLQRVMMHVPWLDALQSTREQTATILTPLATLSHPIRSIQGIRPFNKGSKIVRT